MWMSQHIVKKIAWQVSMDRKWKPVVDIMLGCLPLLASLFIAGRARLVTQNCRTSDCSDQDGHGG